jgi:hypothetical protein
MSIARGFAVSAAHYSAPRGFRDPLRGITQRLRQHLLIVLAHCSHSLFGIRQTGLSRTRSMKPAHPPMRIEDSAGIARYYECAR